MLSGALLFLAACHHGGGVTRAEGGATGGVTGGTPGDAAATGGAAGGSGGNSGGIGGAGSGGAAGASMLDSGAPDLAPADGGGMDLPVDGDAVNDGASDGDGGVTDGGSTDVLFPCGPCSLNWACGGATGTPYTYLMLVPEDDGCYLAGLPGHKLLAPDGTITENGVEIARAQKLGPQVGLYYPDGSQWLFCGGNLPCSNLP